MNASEPHGTLTAMDGAVIPYRAWGDDASRMALVILHGLPYSRMYEAFAQALAAHGIASLAYDQRGFGDTAEPRGHCGRFSLYLDDCAIALSAAAARWPRAQVSLLGHSFGGLVALRYSIHRAGRRGPAPLSLILMAPWIKDKLPVPWRTLVEGVLRSFINPTVSYPLPITIFQTGDPANAPALDAINNDPKFVRMVTGRWFVIVGKAKLGILRDAHSLKLPVLQIEGTEDALVDPDTNRRLFGAIGSATKKLVVLHGVYHDMQVQRELDPVVAPIAEFLGARTKDLKVDRYADKTTV